MISIVIPISQFKIRLISFMNANIKNKVVKIPANAYKSNLLKPK